MLLAGDAVLVAVESAVGEVEPVAASEVCDRITTLGVVSCSVFSDAVRVTRCIAVQFLKEADLLGSTKYEDA